MRPVDAAAPPPLQTFCTEVASPGSSTPLRAVPPAIPLSRPESTRTPPGFTNVQRERRRR